MLTPRSRESRCLRPKRPSIPGARSPTESSTSSRLTMAKLDMNKAPLAGRSGGCCRPPYSRRSAGLCSSTPLCPRRSLLHVRGGVLEPVVAPEQLAVDRDRRHADDADRVRGVGGGAQCLLDLGRLRGGLDLAGVEAAV